MKNLDYLLNKDEFTRDEIIQLLKLDEVDKIQKLFNKATQIRENYFGNEIHLRGIIEFSNYCRQDCTYCGIRKSNEFVERYRMTKQEILEVAKSIFEAEVKTIVLQSGEDLHFKKEEIAEIISEIKSQFDVAITLSLGERPFADYDLWRKCGADRYLLKHETANTEIYKQIHPYQQFDDKIAHLKYLKSIGFQVGSGNIVGLPNQTIEDIADDIILCNQLDVDMASFSPFIHAENTPLANQPNGNLKLLLNTMAVARIVLKNAHIPSTSALATLDEKGREKGIIAGANVIMPCFTPNLYRMSYKIYENKRCISESPQTIIENIINRLKNINVFVSKSIGHTLKG